MSGLHFAEFFHMPIVLSAFSVLSLTYFIVQFKYCRSKKKIAVHKQDSVNLESGHESNTIDTSRTLAHSGGAGKLSIQTNVHSI